MRKNTAALIIEITREVLPLVMDVVRDVVKSYLENRDKTGGNHKGKVVDVVADSETTTHDLDRYIDEIYRKRAAELETRTKANSDS